MPRNNSGVYTLPQSPFTPGTVISSAAVNSNFSDIATALTGSVAANGSTPISGNMRFASGTAIAPSITFSSDATTGFYLSAAGVLGVSAAGSTAGLLVDSTQVGAGKNGNQLYYTNGAIPSPVGSVIDFAGVAAPTGWLLCFGQSLATASYPELFNVIGTTYGGSGSTFNLPDCRGRLTAGKDDMGGSAANRLTSAGSGVSGNVLGAVGGSQNFSLSQANMPVTGPAFFGNASGNQFAQWSGSTGPFANSGGGVNIFPVRQQDMLNTFLPTPTGTIQGGSGVPIATVPPVIIFNKIIFAGRP